MNPDDSLTAPPPGQAPPGFQFGTITLPGVVTHRRVEKLEYRDGAGTLIRTEYRAVVELQLTAG